MFYLHEMPKNEPIHILDPWECIRVLKSDMIQRNFILHERPKDQYSYRPDQCPKRPDLYPTPVFGFQMDNFGFFFNILGQLLLDLEILP